MAGINGIKIMNMNVIRSISGESYFGDVLYQGETAGHLSWDLTCRGDEYGFGDFDGDIFCMKPAARDFADGFAETYRFRENLNDVRLLIDAVCYLQDIENSLRGEILQEGDIIIYVTNRKKKKWFKVRGSQDDEGVIRRFRETINEMIDSLQGYERKTAVILIRDPADLDLTIDSRHPAPSYMRNWANYWF